ncbi:hypothetical protein [Pseudomonas helleri]|uniref:hypothetical protein n=1 Tax=Pseudomonas helleri TaxID=1608996 RepID=UPI00242D92F0|nr:hypothetical protein [Pseudomonas helleri]
MNYSDFPDMQQDEFCGSVFGEGGNLTVIGWSGARTGKLYIVECSVCKQDKELFGDGVFPIFKGSLQFGNIPCGCSSKTRWTPQQYYVRLCRELGPNYYINPDQKAFKAVKLGRADKVEVECKFHGIFKKRLSDMFAGQRCGPCWTVQTQAYIHTIKDGVADVCLKFGIAKNAERRRKIQNSRSVYNIQPLKTFVFESTAKCRAAESECKATMVCGVILRRDMPDGYTETTYLRNLDAIIAIYKKHGGVEAM